MDGEPTGELNMPVTESLSDYSAFPRASHRSSQFSRLQKESQKHTVQSFFTAYFNFAATVPRV